MMGYLEEMIRLAKNGVIFDTNLFLVYLVGQWSINEIHKFKRTCTYNVNDFLFLKAIEKRVGKLVTTPHILTEACNHCDTLNKANHNQVFAMISDIISIASERSKQASLLTKDPLFNKLGLADMSLIDASMHHHLIVTDDAPCYAAIENAGGLGLNINHLRGALWLQ
jgi:hypothetical protein